MQEKIRDELTNGWWLNLPQKINFTSANMTHMCNTIFTQAPTQRYESTTIVVHIRSEKIMTVLWKEEIGPSQFSVGMDILRDT